MMSSWPVLPGALLEAAGPDSEALLSAGCATYRSAARHLHRLPYGRNSDRADYRLVLAEGRGTCSTKHALLAAVAREQELPVSLTIGIYDLDEANTPGVGPVLSAHGLRSIPEAHCYLSYGHHRVDVTRSGASPEAPISILHREWRIEPSQIGEHKVRLHQSFLFQWLTEHPELSLSADELWRIREACILALSGD